MKTSERGPYSRATHVSFLAQRVPDPGFLASDLVVARCVLAKGVLRVFRVRVVLGARSGKDLSRRNSLPILSGIERTVLDFEHGLWTDAHRRENRSVQIPH